MGEWGELPKWLRGLIDETFFAECKTHEDKTRNDKNIFCLRCCSSFCHNCAPSHPSHPLLQVRRHVYTEVVRLDDLKQLIDCSLIQLYTTNTVKAIFLKPRRQIRPSTKSSESTCLRCGRVLQEPFQYCSLTCKVEHVVMEGLDISSILFHVDESEVKLSQFESLETSSSNQPGDEGFEHSQQISPTLEVKNSIHSEGSSSRAIAEEKSDSSEQKDGQDILPKKTKRRKRKGVPHRSPFS